MHPLRLACLLVFLTACTAPRDPSVVRMTGAGESDGNAPPAWAAPPIDRAVTVLDGRTGAVVSFGDMLDALAGADAVFLGETHLDETTHRFEYAVYDALLERRNGAVVLAMEMFERDVQPVLDAYLGREIDEVAFLHSSRAVGNYRSASRPLIERARRDGLPVVASNFPRSLARRVGMEGLGVLDELEPDQRSHAPAELHPNTPAYWRRVDNAVRGHLAMMRGRGGDDQRLSSTQTLWDNAMGESCALALDAHPGSSVLHVNGGFHSAYWDGTVRQFALRKPDARILTVAIDPTRTPSVQTIPGAPVADFVVMAETRATDREEETWSVALDRELEYRLQIPTGASSEQPVPLLIWLGDAGLSSKDGMDLWRDRLGEDVAIAVIEPPYRARYDDLSEGGRWFWPDSFASDVGSAVDAAERIWAYLLRYYAIDPGRVCVAGEGTGATLVSAIALLGDRMDHTALAFQPRRYAKLKDFPLPLPDGSDDSERSVSLSVSGSPADEPWWQEELAAYEAVGLTTAFVSTDDAMAGRDGNQASALRSALGLSDARDAANAAPVRLVVPADTPRAWHWSRLYGLRHTAETGQPVALVSADSAAGGQDATGVLTVPIHPSSIADIIPPCPGPFGGTTVLVLSEDVPAADAQAWEALEESDPLAKKSRFHRVRIARTDAGAGSRTLHEVLTTLEDEGRKNVLVVPAVFCAGSDTMRVLERETRAFGDRMTIQWTPGFGGTDLPVAADAVQQ